MLDRRTLGSPDGAPPVGTGWIGDHVRQHQLRGADERRIGTQAAAGDRRELARRKERATSGTFDDGGLEVREQALIQTTEDHEVGVEDVDEVADAEAEPTADLGDRSKGGPRHRPPPARRSRRRVPLLRSARRAAGARPLRPRSPSSRSLRTDIPARPG